MAVDPLGKLETAFHRWRLKKKHVRERVPEKLMARARRAAMVHGVGHVARVLSIEYARLAEAASPVAKGDRRVARKSKRTGGDRALGKAGKRAEATFSRVEFSTAQGSARPLAEAETPSGLKLRVFAITPETLGLLSALTGSGRVAP